VIPLIVDGKPGDPERECFPPALKFKLDRKGHVTRRKAELLAADAREQGDGKSLSLAKVVAGLLGVSSDDIFRRAERDRRRQERTRGGVVALLAGLTVLGGFFFWQSQQRQQTLTEVQALVAKLAPVGSAEAAVPGAKESLTEAITAIAEGKAADRRYAQALELLKAGKPAEAEPLLREVAEEKAARIKNDSKDAAAAFRNLGAIAGLGDPKRAREAYARAIELDPQDADSLYWHGWLSLLAGNLSPAETSLSQLLEVATSTSDPRSIYRAHLRLGELMKARGRLSEARNHQDQAIAVAQHEVSLRPNDLDWKRELAVGLSKLGKVLLAQGKPAEALRVFQDDHAIIQSLTEANPENLLWQVDLVVCHETIGDALANQESFSEALASYRQGTEIMRRLVMLAPDNLTWRNNLAAQTLRVGETLLRLGNLTEAMEPLHESLAIRQRLTEADPGNSGWQRDLSSSHDRVGDALKAKGDLAGALKAYQDGAAISDRLARTDPNNADWQYDLAVSHHKVGTVLAAEGDYSGALKHYQDALTINEHLAEGDTGTYWQRNIAIGHGSIADVLAQQGETAKAIIEYRKARDIIARLSQHAPEDATLAGDLTWYDDRIAILEHLDEERQPDEPE
jgi:tetratricopeptide (TPR) repeat protein